MSQALVLSRVWDPDSRNSLSEVLTRCKELLEFWPSWTRWPWFI
jgi:hypothetical protein